METHTQKKQNPGVPILISEKVGFREKQYC